MAITPSDYDAVLKDYYTDDKIAEQVYQENPLLGLMPKERAAGRRYVQPVRYAKPGGAASDYATAATNGDLSKSAFDEFLISHTKQYQRVTVTSQLLYSTNSPRESFRKALDEFDDGFRSLGEKLSKRLYRTAGGAAGRLSSSGSVSGTTCTLDDKADAFNFQVGDVINFATGDGTGQLDGGDTTSVTAVDHELGTLTVADTLNVKIAGITTTSYIFHQGDYNACLSGFEDWFPVNNRSSKLAASFHGVTRSAAPVHLGGVYLDGTSLGGIDDVLIKLVGKIAKYGGRTSHIFMNPETISDLQLLSNSKLRTEPLTAKMMAGGDVAIGFSGFKVQIGSRQVSVFGDRSCPSNRIWALQMNTLKFFHAGEPINWLGEEFGTGRLHKHPNQDAMYADLGSYCNVACTAPAWNGVASIPVSS